MEETTAATFCATLVDELARRGVTDAVVAPGSRSTPMALALDADERIAVHVHVDERSAAFVALGLGRATGRPALVLTTSGTATVELHPAVVEASYDRVPLIALTADRPPELQGVGAPQTIDQRELYGRAARRYVDAGVPDEAERATWRALAADVVAASLGDDEARGAPGPVQVNLPFRDPLVGAPGPLPDPIGESERPTPVPLDDVVDAVIGEVEGRRGIIVAGGHVGDADGVLALGRRLGWPVFADPRSGCRVPDERVVAHFDALLRVDRVATAMPDVVLRLGSLPASKVLSQWLGGLDARQVAIDADAWTFAPDGRLDACHRGVPGEVAGRMAERLAATAGDAAWSAQWSAWERAAAEAIDATLRTQPQPNDVAVARAVVAGLPDGADVVVSSSMPVRDVEWYGAPRTGVRVLANRGANGIDGVVSTAVGVALAGRPTALLIGDLAFLHDTNGLLGATGRALDLTVVVVDNDGGAIFSFLPQAEQLPADRYERLFGTPHGLDLVAVARAHGVEASAIDHVDALAPALGAGRGVRVLVVRTDRQANVEAHGALHRAVADAVR